MKDTDKTKKQLVEELGAMRQRIAELEASSAAHKTPEEQIERYTMRFNAVCAIAQTASQTSDLDELLRGSLDKVIEVMQAGAGAIYLLAPAQNALALKAQRGMAEKAISQITTLELTEAELQNLQRWKDPNTPLSEILSGTTLRMISEAMGAEHVQSLVTVPLLMRGQVRGVMILSALASSELAQDDLELLRIMSNQISMGIANATLLEKTRDLSLTDELTGLYNRRYFYVALRNEMHRAQRYGPSSSLIMLDIDGFKEYNGKFGHTAGDSALKALSQTLTADLRKTDMAFRYGGDEFAIILPATGADIAKKIADRIRSKWAQVSKTQYGAQESALGLSAGVVQFPRDANTADGLVLLAETAIHGSRREGGGKSTLASELGAVHSDIPDTFTVDQVYALAATVDARDPFARGHWERVAATSDIMGKAIGLPEGALADLHAAALLHDIGKVNIPDSIVIKPDQPTEREWEIIRQHSTQGAQIVSNVKELSALAPIIRHHHESYDGTGYPDGLKGEDIPLGARIIIIADAYDTMTTIRPYRNVISRQEACGELRRCSGSQFNPSIVEAFVRAIEANADRD